MRILARIHHTGRTAAKAAVVLVALSLLAACGGGGSESEPTAVTPVANPTPPAPASVVAVFRVRNIRGDPVPGTVISVASGATMQQATSGADGSATLSSVPVGTSDISWTAAGYEPVRITARFPSTPISITLRAVGEWANGLPVGLGSQALDRAPDGSTLTFSVDVAVLKEGNAPLSNLTASDFNIVAIDCGWGGPRDCASDSAGNAPNGGYFTQDGPMLGFAVAPPAARRPFVVDVLVERSRHIRDWQYKIPALKSFFAALGGNDAARFSLIEEINGTSVLDVQGPYTGDGRPYLPLIDRLESTNGDFPALEPGIEASIRATAAAAASTVTGTAQPVVVLFSQSGLTTAQVDRLGAIARQLGVRVAAIQPQNQSYYGLSELAFRTGGFYVTVDDARQLQTASQGLDALLATSVSSYRMTFRIRGKAGTFLSGGNAKIFLKAAVPSAIPDDGTFTYVDVAIP